MSNVAKFNAELEAASKKIHGDFKKFHRQVCLEVLKRIVLRTPVDTGRARGNWQTEIGRAASGVLSVDGSEGNMADFAISSGISKLANIPAFSVVHITNNVSYLYYLEYSRRSKQAPEGFLEITLSELALWLGTIK